MGRFSEGGEGTSSAESWESRFPLFFFSLAFRGDVGIISSSGYFIHARLTPLRKSPVAGPCAVNGACDPRLHNAIILDACNSTLSRLLGLRF